MNKTISVFISLILILCMPCSVVTAQSDVSVTIENPSDGSVVENTAFEVELSTSGNISDTVLEFDGTRISGYTLSEDMLTLGKHTLIAYVIGNDGSVESATSTFTVIKTIDAVRIDNSFEDVNSAADYLNKESVDLGNGVTLMPKLSAHGSSVAAVVGSDGGVAINVSSANSVSKNKPFFKFTPQPAGSLIGNSLNLSFYVNVNPGTKVYFSFSDTDKVTAYLDGSKGYLSSYCPAGTWCKVDVSLNILKDTSDMKVSYYDGSEIKSNVVYTDKPITAADKNTLTDIGCINDIRINYEGSAKCGLSIDNILLSEEPSHFTGIRKVGYIYDFVETSDSYPDSEKLDSIKVYMNEAVIAEDLSDKFSLTDANDNVVEVSSVSASDDGMEVTVVPAQALVANTEYILSANLSANYLGTCLDTDKSIAVFKTSADSYAMTDVELKVNSTKLLTAAQLSGKKLTANVHFSNSESGNEKLSIVLAVRSGKKLIGLKLVNAIIPGKASDFLVSLETDILPDDIADVRVQIMFLDNMSARMPVFTTHEVIY